MEIRQGEIYWVTIKATETAGSEQKKNRPYVIVSRNQINRLGPNVVGVPFTSKLHHARGHRVLIPVSQMIPNVACARKLSDSVALTDQIRVLDKSRLESPKMGDLSETAKYGLEGALANVFDIR
jgi:mRNA-degrading endonuclease toxin of MazEF toxin-antitoxin module